MPQEDTDLMKVDKKRQHASFEYCCYQ